MPETKCKNSTPSTLNVDYLRRIAGQTTFDRGEFYFQQGRVVSLLEGQGMIIAKVIGSDSYQVKLRIEGNNTQFSCTCPMGQAGSFCKHNVAVGLTYLDQKSGKLVEKPRITIDDVRKWLESQNKKDLINVVIEHALYDERLLRQLFLKVTKNSPDGVDTAAYKQAINEVVHASGFVSYREVYDYAFGINEVIDSIEELLEDSHDLQLVELVEYALNRLEDAINMVDDSSGEVGSILSRLQALHLKACRNAGIDPEELASRLFEWELRSDFDVFYEAAETYADILGKKGLAKYRELAEKEWANIPELVPGSDSNGKYGHRFRITSIMESLAKQTGNVEAVIAIKKKDLSSAWAYYQIAETYKKAGKDDLALDWAEQGIKAFPNHTDSRLRAFLIAEYLYRKRHDEAMSIAWQEFLESPTFNQYCKLEGYASKIDQWPFWRTRALELIRNNISQKKRENQQSRYSQSWDIGHTILVQIFLWENDVESAWNEASEGGCSDSLWVKLADKRRETHPEDVIPIYQKAVESAINEKNNDSYGRSVEFLKLIESLMARLKRESEFTHYLNSIRVTHKAKRNLMKLLLDQKF